MTKVEAAAKAILWYLSTHEGCPSADLKSIGDKATIEAAIYALKASGRLFTDRGPPTRYYSKESLVPTKHDWSRGRCLNCAMHKEWPGARRQCPLATRGV